MKPILIVLFCFSLTTAVWADEAYDDYDSIVSRLSTSENPPQNSLNLDSLRLHAGLSYGTSLSNLRNVPNAPSQITFQGFRVSLGIDLFYPDLITEIGYTNYLPETKRNQNYKMNEFDLRTYYIGQLSRMFSLRAGAGVGARYLNNDSNPVGILILGGEAKLGPKISFVTEASYKDSFATDTLEKTAYDLTFRLDGHF